MKLLKKSLSLCLMLSIICTTLVFTGGGTVLAATNQWTDDITPSDNIANVVPDAGDVIWLEADVAPLATDTGNTGKGYYGLGFRVGDKNSGRRTLGFYSNNYSTADSRNGLYIMFQDNNGTPGKLKVATINEKAHVALKQEYGDTDYAVTSVYVNGVLVKTHTGTDKRTQYVYPNKGETLKAVVQRCGYTEDEQAFSNVKSYLNPTDENDLFANFTDLAEDDNYIITTGEGTAAEDLLWNNTTEWYTTTTGTTSPGFTNFGITCPEGTKWNELLEKLDKGTATAKINDEDVTDTDTRELVDGDKITLTSVTGKLTNTYTVKIPMPIRIASLESSYEYGELTEIKAELGDEVGTIGPENIKLYIDDEEITDADCNIVGKNVTFTNFDCGIGEHTVKVEVTGVAGGPYSKTVTTTITLSNPFSLNIAPAMNYDNFTSVTAGLSRYFDADGIEDAKLFFNGEEQTDAIWSVQDNGTLTFDNITPWLGSIDVKAEFTYNNERYSDETVTKLERYEFTQNTKWAYYDPWGKSEPGDKANFIDYKYGSGWSDFTGKSNTSNKTLRTQYIGTAPGADVSLYRFTSPVKFIGDTGITLFAGFAKSESTAFYKHLSVEKDSSTDTYIATAYDANGIGTVFAEGLQADTKYTLEAIINQAALTADLKLTAEDGTAYFINGVSVADAIASGTFKQFRFEYKTPDSEGPVSVGAATLDYGKAIEYITSAPANDGTMTIELADNTIISADDVLSYIEVTDSQGNEIYVYDVSVTDNKIEIMSNDLSRGETYQIKLSEDFVIGSLPLGTALVEDITIPFEDFDVTNVEISKASNKVSVTANVQNLTSSPEKLTMIVNITAVEDGKEVSKGIYTKSFDISASKATGDDGNPVIDNIPYSSGDKVNVFFVDNTGDYIPLTNRTFIK